jgi:Na+-translocating ferredoxin:NAD+ oxidoreductase RnfG subunit
LYLVCAVGAHAAVFASEDEGVKQAFPDADKIEAQHYVLDDAQVTRVEQLAQAKLERHVWTIHTASRAGEVLGYAVLDIDTVRTLPEALLVVLTKDGAVRSLRVLAFHEPSEYQPRQSWLDQFAGKKLSPELQLRRDVLAIAGATLSSQSVTRAVRRSLALYQVLLQSPAAAE